MEANKAVTFSSAAFSLSADSGFLDDHDDESVEKKPRASLYQKSKKRKSFVMVLVALFLSAVVLTVMSFFMLKSSQQIEFETAFEIFAREATVVAEMHAENVFGQLQSLASALRSGMYQNEYHYYHQVAIHDFDLRSEEITNLTGIELLMFVPFVPHNERDAFEQFQYDHQQWIVEGYEHRGWDASHLKTIPRHIYDYVLPHDYNDTRRGYVDTGFMQEVLVNNTAVNSTNDFSTPVAQIGPRLSNTSVVMMNLFTHPVFKKEIIASLEYDVPVISEVEDLQFLLEHVLPRNSSEPIDYSEPRSFTLDPVRAEFGDNALTVGYVVGILQWKTFF